MLYLWDIHILLAFNLLHVRGDGIMLGRRPFIDRYPVFGDIVDAFEEPYYLHSDYYLRQTLPKSMARCENKIVSDWPLNKGIISKLGAEIL